MNTFTQVIIIAVALFLIGIYVWAFPKLCGESKKDSKKKEKNNEVN